MTFKSSHAKQTCAWSMSQDRRNWRCKEADFHPKYFADTLFQCGGGADSALLLLFAPPIFQTFHRTIFNSFNNLIIISFWLQSTSDLTFHHSKITLHTATHCCLMPWQSSTVGSKKKNVMAKKNSSKKNLTRHLSINQRPYLKPTI